MHKWKKLSFCAVLLTSLAFAGCGTPQASTTGETTGAKQEQSSAPQAMQVNLNTGEPSTIDPGLAEDIPSMSVARAAFDGLLRLNEKGELKEAVAEKYEVSADGLTYTFHLRESKWTNGDPVTAHDFEYAWKRVLDPKTASSYAYQMYYLKNGQAFNANKAKAEDVGVKATDDKTLVVTLENPAPFFPELVASVTYFPVNKKAVEGNKEWASKPETYITNGPFTLKNWEHKSKIEFEKSDSYWDKDAVKLSKLTLNMIEDANTELSMFEKGDLDWAGSPLGDLPLDALDALKESGKMQAQATAGTYWYIFNTTQKPFDNKKIRQAFATAVNRQAISDNVVPYKSTPATGILPPTMALTPEGYIKDGDVETAKKLLAEGMKEAGIKELPSITIAYNTSEVNSRIATVIQDQWRKAFGIEVKLVNKENKVHREDMKQGNFTIGRGSWIGDFNDPINFLEVFKGGLNTSKWENKEFLDLLAQSAKEGDVAKRKEILKKAEQIVMDEMPALPIYYFTYAWVKQDSVKDVVVDALGFIDFKYASNQK
ncbi:peptide ABC transporter substrate-binding protein [Brevibacillus formosus]|uniref:peptide ABC transporter substrate-binding protein n=1 Tax=Brevibacillus TaxID=55080 RepID=UPI000D10CD23|nr:MULTISPECIES: peptide ABC transporter substrate-binding protein [Brevibacillus]MBG9944550.1 ABC transporter substrate-binding protein [Brevibacillus formosus]MED1946323.1 peptide ABC transporter substrate-binding protein [Brevibacillus formosus]MED1998755.1 peptide ABC transporter substrate-binding protein [Brevibacillus formosus]MED2084188.1 peptide ABC transporter substrate-binding protein [Brevibacillus formosus]PSK18327.1 ABC transporter substrate-binding protein [Brevibacillus sp. NRRL